MHETPGGSLRHFWRTQAQRCPYLPDREERKIITDLSGVGSVPLYNELSRSGFRRSHHYAYRPVCIGCQACLPVRIPVRDFIASRSVRRIAAGNRDLVAMPETPQATDEQYALFRRYLELRHAESDMAEMNYADFRIMIEASAIDTMVLTLRDSEGRLLGACLADALDDGYSAVYSFYDPELPRRGLGTYLVMQLVELARKQNLPYVYLGYWIANSRKMAYKTRFQPLEALGAEGWRRMEMAAE